MAAPPLLAASSRATREALRRRLDILRARLGRRYLAGDPLAFVHRYEGDDDRELAGFLAAGLAFGNVRSIQASVSSLLGAMGDSPARFVDRFEAPRDGAALAGLYHRWITDKDLVAILALLRAMRERSGSIGGFFREGHDAGAADIGPSLTSFSERALALAAGSRARRGRGTVAPFFPSPRGGSACKRLNLYLRWMVRGDDGLDLGLWEGIPTRQLVLPLDTHLARISRALGLTRRRTPGWAMAVEATRSLALLDADDPVKYDFALCRLGILDLCLHGRDPLECRVCPPPLPRSRGARAAASSRSRQTPRRSRP